MMTIVALICISDIDFYDGVGIDTNSGNWKPAPKLPCSWQGPPECLPPDDEADDQDVDDDKHLSHLALEVVHVASKHRVWGHICLAWAHDSVPAWFG